MNHKFARSDKGQFTFTCFLVVTAFTVFLTAPVFAGRQNATSTDANAIVRKMIETYQKAESIHETSAANYSDSKGTKLSQSYVIKYQKPNKFVITSVDPTNGTLAAYSNGSVVRFFSGMHRQYAENRSAPDPATTVDVIGQLARKVTSNGFDQSLNPISFLLAQGMPRECRSFKYAGVKTVEGHKVFVVSGTADEAWTRSVVPVLGGTSTARDLTLFIDAKTYLLLRAKAHLVWAIKTPAHDGKPAASKEYSIHFEETHFGTALGERIPPDDFTFTPTGDVALKP